MSSTILSGSEINSRPERKTRPSKAKGIEPIIHASHDVGPPPHPIIMRINRPSKTLSAIRARPRIANNAAMDSLPLLRIKKPFLSEIYTAIPTKTHKTKGEKTTHPPVNRDVDTSNRNQPLNDSRSIPQNMATPTSMTIPISARSDFSSSR